MASNGDVLNIPNNGRREFAGYDYCVTNWCITTETESLFLYNSPDFGFDFFRECDTPYPGTVDLSQATPELIALCGTDVACLMDGIQLGIEGAQNLLDLESILNSSSTSSRFRVVPSNIVVGETVNVVLIGDCRMPIPWKKFRCSVWYLEPSNPQQYPLFPCWIPERALAMTRYLGI